MNDEHEAYSSHDIEDEGGGLLGFLARRPAWQKVLLVVSIVMMVSGVGLGVYASLGPEPEPTAAATNGGVPRGNGGAIDPDLVAGLGPGEPGVGDAAGDGTVPAEGEDGAAPKTGAALWSPAIFRLGFGFFAGFAVAAATRLLVKTIVIGAGIFLILLFGLEQAELVTVNWNIVSTKGDAVLDTLGAQFSSLASFFAGYLPTIGAGTAGAVMGFRK